jgi:hypothetical protein
MNAQGSAQALAEYWQQHEGVLADDLPLGDLCKLQLRELMLSEVARQQLSAALDGLGEYLPVSYKGTQWYLFNTLKTIDANPEESALDKFGAVERIVFNEKDLDGVNVWTSSFGNYCDLYCTQQWVDTVEGSGLKGLAFLPLSDG